jgi:hypothetical protein
MSSTDVVKYCGTKNIPEVYLTVAKVASSR